MAVVGLPPMGCLPIMITLNSNGAVLQRGCMDQFSSVARDYNALLQTELASMQSSLASQGSRIYYADIYQPLTDMIQRFPSYGESLDLYPLLLRRSDLSPSELFGSENDAGFDEALSGCCGTGMLEASFMCNPKSYVCPDASRYVFWDSIHPSEKTYYLLFQSLRPLVDAIIRD